MTIDRVPIRCHECQVAVFELQLIAGQVCLVVRAKHYGEPHVTVLRLDRVLEEAERLQEQRVA